MNRKNFSLKTSNDIQDIIAVNKRSCDTKTPIRIMELSSLSALIPVKTAESIRQKLLGNNVRVMQITNLKNLDPWTEVSDFVKTCLQIRYISKRLLPIHVETLIFDNVVAFYRVKPDVSVTIIENQNFAAQQAALFDEAWKISIPVNAHPDGSISISTVL